MSYEVGRFYQVPTVYGRYYSFVRVWPVLGQLHEDAEHIGFKDLHWHLDVRFLPQRVFKRLAKHCVWRHEGEQGFARAAPLMFTALGEKFSRTNHPKPVLRKMRCQRQYAHSYPMDKAPWLPALEADTRNQCLVKGHCPHRGTDLSTLPIDQFGCIECPLHGLVFKADTGERVPRAQWNQWREQAEAAHA